MHPSSQPSTEPSALPSSIPSGLPTCSPSNVPTAEPSSQPTSVPSWQPSGQPSNQPSLQPTSQPSKQPSSQPSGQPSEVPSSQPTTEPTGQPSVHPSSQPSGQPSGEPSGQPTNQPSGEPSVQPTSQPSGEPTSSPTESFYDHFFFDSSAFNDIAAADATFEFIINDEADISNVNQQWQNFITDELAIPFKLDFYSVHMFVSGVRVTDQEVFVLDSVNCSKTEVNDGVIASLITTSSSSSALHSMCDGLGFISQPGVLCIGCEVDVMPECSYPSNGTIVLPTDPNCAAGDEKITKHAVAILFYYREELVASVPTVVSMELTATKTNITVKASVLSTAAGGMLYCGAYKSSSLSAISMTRSLVKSSGYSVPVIQQARATTVSVTFFNLVPATNYSVFCHIEDSLANKGSLDSMLSLLEEIETSCCKEVTFIAAPAVVRITTAPDSQYMFTYKLPAFPTDGTYINVTVAVEDDDGESPSGVSASPLMAHFSDATRHLGLSRSIVVFADALASTNETYHLHLVVSGTDGSKYKAPDKHQFTVISDETLIPAPTLSSAIFSDSGRSLSVCFDEVTDQGQDLLGDEKDAAWKCNIFFNFTGAQYTSCTWVSKRCIEMVFCGNGLCAMVEDRGALDLLEPAEIIKLNVNSVKGACYTEQCIDDLFQLSTCRKCPVLTNDEQTITVMPPLVPLLPEVYVVASAVDGACKTDALVLDASSSFGSGGRPWKSIVWTVTANTTVENTNSLQNYLNSLNDVSSPISIAHSMLNEVVYTFTLRLLNFFQSSSGETSFSSVEVDATSTLPIPTITFDSPGFRRVYSYDELSVSVSLTLPSCLEISEIVYKWRLFKDLSYQSAISSTSPDPQRFILDPYTLEAGLTYTVYVTASSEVSATGSALLTVFVEESSVFVSISGPSALLIPYNHSLELDASASAIKDQPPGISNTVLLSWTCTVSAVNVVDDVSSFHFGDTCDNMIDVSNLNEVASKDIVPLKTHMMESNVEFKFTASALSGSEVLGSDSVTVQVTDSSNNDLPFVTMSSSFNKFNANSILQVMGIVTPANSRTVHCDWKVYDDGGEELTVVSTTPDSKSFSSAALPLFYAFSASPFTFVTGKTYSFQLSARFSTGFSSTFSILTVTANGPPTAGQLRVSPTQGYSFVTKFLFQALYWIEDRSDFPISYVFRYSLRSTANLNSTSTFLSLGLASQRSYVESLLPPGFASTNRTLLCSLLVSDIFGATAEERVIITVDNSTSKTSATSLNQSLSEAVRLGDTDALGQGVNNAATDLTVAECSNAPDCFSLNRDDCYDTAHTCGSCLTGYTGIAGDSNAECYVEETKFTFGVGDACSIDSDCSTFFCSNGFCYAPVKACPSISDDSCSGNGECLSYDKTTGELLENCTASTLNCVPACNCSEGHFGSACSLNWEQYVDRVQSRALMCQGLLHIASQQAPSTELLSYLASSLQHILNPNELGSIDNIVPCLEVIHIITNVTNLGYMNNDALLAADGSASPQQALSWVISKLLDYLLLMNVRNDTSYFLGDVMNLVDSVVRGISQEMVGGEENLVIVSSGLRLSVGFYALDELRGAVIQPPLTITDSRYDRLLPTVTLPPTGFDICSELSGIKLDYVRLYIMEWISNPYLWSNSTAQNQTLGAPILRFASIGSEGEAFSSNTSDVSALSNTTYSLTVYWNFELNGTDGYATQLASYEEDGSVTLASPCSVSTFNTTTVTYTCHDLENMCPSVNSQRRLSPSWHSVLSGFSSIYPDVNYFEKQSHRKLDFDYEGEGDDDKAVAATYADFGVLIDSIGEEFVTTFGSPGNFDLEEGLPVLLAVSFVVIVFAVGIVWFHRWDMNEIYKNRYITVGLSKTLSETLNSSPQSLEAFIRNNMDSDISEESDVSDDASSCDEFEQDLESLHSCDISRANVNVRGVESKPTLAISTLASLHSSRREYFDTDVTMLDKERDMINDRFSSLPCESSDSYESNLDCNGAVLSKSIEDDKVVSDTVQNEIDAYQGKSYDIDECIPSPSSYRPPSLNSTRPSDLLVRQFARKHIYTEAELGTVPLRKQLRKVLKRLWRLTKKSCRSFYKVISKCGNVAMRVHVPTIAEIRQEYKTKLEKKLEFSINDGDTVSSFLERSLPPSVTLTEKSGFKRFLNAVLREHDWLRCFTYSSSRFPRVMRFLVVFTNVIILFFVDSLFFAILFPNDNYCENFSGFNGGDEESCLSRESRMQSDTTYCTWDEKEQLCELRPPPTDIIFFFIISILVSLMSIVPATLCESMLINICALRPRFSDSESHQMHNKTVSALGHHMNSKKNKNNKIDRVLEVYSYFQHCSVEDELNAMLSSLEDSLTKGKKVRKLPWTISALVSDYIADNADAVKDSMGLDDDGNPLPLTALQKFIFKNPRKRVEWKLKKAREEELEILDELDLFVDGEEDLMDVLLIQKFILEQLTPFRRYALQAEFFQFDGAAPAFVNGYLWVLSWLIIILVWLFCVAWMFFWAVNNGTDTVSVWGYQIIFVVMQDIFINEIMQIFVVNILTVELLRPQLRQIYKTLHVVLSEKMDALNTSRDSGEMIRVVQHLSAACRVSHIPSLRHLPACQLLSKVNDRDVQLCRESRASELGWFTKFVVTVPTVLAMMHESVQESILDVIIPTMWCCFLIAHVVLWNLHPFFGPLLMSSPYIVVIFVLLHRYCWLIPRRHARRAEFSNSNMQTRERRNYESMQLMWRNMNLNLALRGNITNTHVDVSAIIIVYCCFADMRANEGEVLHLSAKDLSSISFALSSAASIVAVSILNP